jgi:hypothetical protein
MSDSTAQGSLMSSGDAIPLAALWLGSGRTRSPDQRDLSGICRHTPITDLQTAACQLVCELAARAWPLDLPRSPPEDVLAGDGWWRRAF